ncbi:efflux RND transporter periplasmic adaptor subunit [Marivirga lumbricoides]|uniref:Efflux RND transporter periplasmic adaptor subunit n=1 Tax=Marivirga lumbricoides TaxID=1046115 RepID=A0A2T4DP70_9BACT|nr:efflux RND transporter periplasmic adaptor subunit [Marivirga lumbricoides]
MNVIKQIGLFSIIVLMAFGCENNASIPDKANSKAFCLNDNFKKKIKFEQLISQNVVEEIPLTGVVEPNPDKVIHFVSLVGGIISNTYFSLGDKVNRGQVLAELRSTELSSLEAELSNLNAQIKVAERQLASVRSMYDDEISSERDLLEAESELDILRSEKNKITSHLNLFSASTQRGVFEIKAPTSGIITDKNIAAGMQISAEGESLFTISDLSEVWVMVNIYASNIEHIQEGMDVKIKTLSYPDKVFKGNIERISQAYDQEAKVLKARVSLQNDNLKLKPGMLVDVVAFKQTDIEALSVPTKAIVFSDDHSYVVTYQSDCQLEAKEVTITSSGNDISFISGDLKENEKIISQNQLLIYEQLKNFQN